MRKKYSSFDLLAPFIQRWIWRQGWHSLNEIQEKAIPIILKGDSDVIISAATAGGKTEAALFPILTSIEEGAYGGCKVLYISPLKALINDQHRRLLELTEGTNITVTPWHQDVSYSAKNRFLKASNGVLIITPESLESFLMNRRAEAEDIFGSLRYIVIDELHAFIGSERGKQLQSLLSRVELISSHTIPRIAMSATFPDFSSVKSFLRDDKKLPCAIVTQENSSHEVKILIKEYIADSENNVDEMICNELMAKLRGSNNLVFVNARFEAEMYAMYLSELSDRYGIPNEFRIHHGSISREIRESVEYELQEGNHPVTAICTSTMELGVDIGKVKSIAQIRVANSVSGLRQRLGRSGRRNEPSILRILSIDNALSTEGSGRFLPLQENLFQNIAIVELLKDKKFEKPSNNGYHFSTLIQQLLSLIVSYGSIFPKEAWTVLCVNGAFGNVSSEVFLNLLRSLGKKGVISQLMTGAITMGLEGESIVQEKDFYATFMPLDEYSIFDINSGRVGIIQKKPRVGTCIILAAKIWKVVKINKRTKVAYVLQTSAMGEFSFEGGGAEVDPIIVEKMKEIYESNVEYAYIDVKAIEQLKIGRQFFKDCNLHKTPFIEYQGTNYFFTWAGTKVNYTIELIAAYNLKKEIGYSEMYVQGITQSDVVDILCKRKPDAVTLASQIPFEDKIKQKYDHLLSEQLLNMEYAQTCIDINGAWKVLESMNGMTKP